ncbi:hypothetical protein A2291_05370 [candidate division WOR-1 bacterium RIFOXYB2_FULL_42_35]|nr:MAG: hypothetical protein A2247_00140 [candidate division WOR-1 bacterium RIFOXYA2_FULL_41_14]OGC24770.1 MAG: hypothetical protein A2291_05370 [candidate division WOR-1 bacterium RIFOXYB2_FULL_42_35]
MDYDLKLLADFEEGRIPSTLRIYSWQPKCITLGYAQKVDQEIDVEKARELGWDVVKRPTGGGIVFHNEAEVTYSLVTALDNPLLPKGMIASYKKISEAIAWALKQFGIEAEVQNSKIKVKNKFQAPSSKLKTNLCFSYPAEYEIVVGGRKIVGSAQKRGKKALLQQGSIFVRETPKDIFQVLKKPYQEQDAVSVEEVAGKSFSFGEIGKVLVFGFEKVLGVKLQP